HQLGQVLEIVLAQGRIGVLLNRQRRGRVRAMEPDHAARHAARELSDLVGDVDQLLALARLDRNRGHAPFLACYGWRRMERLVDLIPHRPPWLLVDRVTARGDDFVTAEKRVAAADPLLAPDGSLP